MTLCQSNIYLRAAAAASSCSYRGVWVIDTYHINALRALWQRDCDDCGVPLSSFWRFLCFIFRYHTRGHISQSCDQSVWSSVPLNCILTGCDFYLCWALVKNLYLSSVHEVLYCNPDEQQHRYIVNVLTNLLFSVVFTSREVRQRLICNNFLIAISLKMFNYISLFYFWFLTPVCITVIPAAQRETHKVNERKELIAGGNNVEKVIIVETVKLQIEGHHC